MIEERSNPTAGEGFIATRLAGPTREQWPRLLAVGSSLVLMGSFLAVPYYVTDVVGGSWWLSLYVVASFLLATAFARLLPDGLDLPVGIAVGFGILVAGLGAYLLLIPDVYYALFTVDRVVSDTVALLTGQSVLLLLNADLWALGIAPGPVFLTWYFCLRRHYELAAVAGAVTLVFFTLTGDTSATETVIGMAATLGTLGFGSIDRWSGTWDQVQDVGLVLIAAVLAARTLDIVPNSAGRSGASLRESPTLEGTLVGTPGQVAVVGSITLSPRIRFHVEADEGSYWRVTSYDRYTGQGWVSTADTRPYDGALSGPPGDSRGLEQRFEVEATSQAMPAAWKPVAVDDSWADDTRVSDDGGFAPGSVLEEGDSYEVVSRVPIWSGAELRESQKAYPDAVSERFLQLPDGTPERLEERAREIAGDVDAPFQAMIDLRDWLQSEKTYSLEVPRIGENVADRFVFDLDRGYCVHFATALTVMLRTIGVPARFVVGYTRGEPVDDGRYRVRGLHSHAWTEVFFPETGWITVDATPAGPRRTLENRRLERAGAEPRNSEGGGDSGRTAVGAGSRSTAETDQSTETTSEQSDPAPTPTNADDSNVSGATPREGGMFQEPGSPTIPDLADRANPAAETGTDTGESAPRAASNRAAEDRVTILAGLLGLVLGAYRVGLVERAYRTIWVRRQPASGSPRTDVERAFERVEYLLSRAYRDREPDETARAYVRAIEEETGDELDERIHRVVDSYERVRYSGSADPEEAATVMELVDELVDER